MLATTRIRPPQRAHANTSTANSSTFAALKLLRKQYLEAWMQENGRS